MQENTKLFCISIAALLIINVISMINHQVNAESVEPTIVSTDGLTKTVAHLNIPATDMHQLVYKDSSKDVAFYEVTGSYSQVCVGDKVYIRGIECEVIATDMYGFTLKENFDIQVGYSGSAVITADDVQVGYVSERLPDNRIFCIWS